MPRRELRFTPSKSASFQKPEAASCPAPRVPFAFPPPQEALLAVADLKSHGQEWLFDGEYRQHSKNTVETRRLILKNLIWFLEGMQCAAVDVVALKQFFHYMKHGHEDDCGRWGNPVLRNPLRPRTVKDYHCHIRTFFRWMLSEGIIDTSPMERIPPPVSRADQIQPFTPDEVQALLGATKRSKQPLRNLAIVLLLLDTGMRASELCGLKIEDVNMQGQNCRVLGKGNKHRTVYFGRNTFKNLSAYLREMTKAQRGKGKATLDPAMPLFSSDAGKLAGEALTTSGLLTLIKRLGTTAKVQGTRCSPHTFRHTCAVEFLRAGGNVFALKELFGHTSLHMTNRYVSMAQADIENQHRQFSPADRLKAR